MRTGKVYTPRRDPYTVYVTEWKQIASRQAMKHQLMTHQDFKVAYANVLGDKTANPARTLAKQSRAVTYKQAQHIQKVLSAQDGMTHKVAEIMKDPTKVDWKFVQGVSAQWS